MAKKWTTDLIQDFLNKNYDGYTVNQEYKNDCRKLTFTCPKGHISNISFRSFRDNKNKCTTCRLENTANAQLEKLYKLIEDENYTIIKFIEKKRILVQCSCGHEPYEVKIGNFIYGRRCKYCAWEKLGNERRLPYAHVQEYIKKAGYSLLSNSYKNNEEMLSVRCNDGHIYNVSFNNFKSGYRCPYCANQMKHTYEQTKERIEKFGYILLTKKEDYNNTSDKLKVICPRGHNGFTRVDTLSRGGRCIKCSFEDRTGERGSNWQGGVTEINGYLRTVINEWKLASMKSNNFNCDITGTRGHDELEVHHLIPFSKLTKEMFEVSGIEFKKKLVEYSIEERNTMKEVLLNIHFKKLGVPLLRHVHVLFHKTFGFSNTNEDQYIFFKENYTYIKNGLITREDYYKQKGA